jgi:hypothetical protein
MDNFPRAPSSTPLLPPLLNLSVLNPKKAFPVLIILSVTRPKQRFGPAQKVFLNPGILPPPSVLSLNNLNPTPPPTALSYLPTVLNQPPLCPLVVLIMSGRTPLTCSWRRSRRTNGVGDAFTGELVGVLAAGRSLNKPVEVGRALSTTCITQAGPHILMHRYMSSIPSCLKLHKEVPSVWASSVFERSSVPSPNHPRALFHAHAPQRKERWKLTHKCTCRPIGNIIGGSSAAGGTF